MVATAQRFGELHPEVTITWEKRSLQAFADSPIEELAKSFDLLVVDHPFMGFAEKNDVLLELGERISPAVLADHAANSIGSSHDSYSLHGKRWALAIDAATPISGWREDLMAQHGLRPPSDWNQLLELARSGFVAIAGIPVDCLMNFFMLCHAAGEEPCVRPNTIISREVGMVTLERQAELTRLLPDYTWNSNPIKVWDRIAHASAGPLYCPVAYGYSNYARNGYAPNRLRFGVPPKLNGRRLRPTLGGTGLAISARCQDVAAALDYAIQVADARWQRTLYFDSGGQPAHGAAWGDANVDRAANGFFSETLPAMEDSWVRPRYCGYLNFQAEGGTIVRDFLIGKTSATETLAELDSSYRRSRGSA